MKFATFDDGTPFGRLYLVSRDLTHCALAGAAGSLQAALESWVDVAPALENEYAALNSGDVAAQPFDARAVAAPMPRAWQWLDGSAFGSHGALMDKVLGIEAVAAPGRPLMYQGMSDRFLAPCADVLLPSEADGIDFEGEFGVMTDAVPLGVCSAEAARHIRLVVLINDWSLRALAGIEMKTGFGWIQAKPACGMAPVAVTPDELGSHWQRSRVALPLDVYWNGRRFGRANGLQMDYGFDELISHGAYSRAVSAGTVIGSGTVSNNNYREVGSSCIAERRGIETIDQGEASTAYMRFGDQVRMEVIDPTDNSNVFGTLEQRVVAARARHIRDQRSTA